MQPLIKKFMFNTIEEYYQKIDSDALLRPEDNLIPSLGMALSQHGHEAIWKLELAIEQMQDPFDSERLTEEHYEHLSIRATEIKNVKRKALYNHILYLKTLNRKLGALAVDNYIDLLTDCNFEPQDNPTNVLFSRLYKQSFDLSQKIRHRHEDVIRLTLEILVQNKINGHIESVILDHVVTNTKKLGKEILESIYRHNKAALNKPHYMSYREDFLTLQAKVAQKLGSDTTQFFNALGDLYVDKAAKRPGFHVQKYYHKAMLHYQSAGNQTAVETTAALMEKGKKNIKLAEVRFEINNPIIDLYFETKKKQFDELTGKGSAEDIYSFLAKGDIYPRGGQNIIPLASNLQNIVSIMSFDINKNITNPKPPAINTFHFHLENFTLPFLKDIFLKGIISGKISYESLYGFLENHTWFGLDVEHILNTGEHISFRWMDLLVQPLEFAIRQITEQIDTNTVVNSVYQMPLDSLVVKFEGLFRAFSQMIEAQTLELKGNQIKERISFEKLFENPKFKDCINEEDMALFRYLLTDEGINLRNNIAHAFYRPKSYHAAPMLLVIAALLKLGTTKVNIEK